MVERRPVIDHEQVVFEGLFRVKDIYRLMNDWQRDRAYVYVEKRAHESVTKTGKHVEVELEPYKKFSDYAKAVMRIHFTAHNLQDVEVTIDGHKQKMQKGKLIVTLDSWLETDYEQRWETQPVFYVLRSLFEKYVYVPFLSGFIKGVRDDTLHLKEQIKAYLNLERVGSSA
jgi:hypothetical protein